MTTYILDYEVFDKDFGLQAEEYGIKAAVPLRIAKNISVKASNGFEAQTKLEADLKARFGNDKQIHFTSCLSQEAFNRYKKAQQKLKSL